MPSIREEEMANLEAISVSRLGSLNVLLFDAMVNFRFMLTIRYKQAAKDTTPESKPIQTLVCRVAWRGQCPDEIRDSAQHSFT